MSYSRLLLLPLLAAALLAPVRATTVPEMSFEEVVASSAAIVHGKVVRSWTSWDPERTAIWTHYAIHVNTRLKGGPGTLVTISEPGGELDGKHMLIAGAPRYEVGDEVVVFAAETPIGYLRTCGWGQGKFEVRRTEPGGRPVVRTGALGVRLVAGKDGASAPAAALDGSELEPFFGRVREVMATQRARGAR